MGSNSKRPKACIEDRISELPDAVRCHILSFLPTRNAVKTCLLSHRWKNTWASVLNLDLCATSPNIDSDRSAGFVDRVLLFRGWSDIHSFRLRCKGIKTYFSRIDAWICTAIRRNVVELDLDLFQDRTSFFLGQSEHGASNNVHVLPKSLFLCKTLVVLKLNLDYNVIAIVPNSNCFPNLKYLHVKVSYPIIVKSMEKLFSCCPALVDLTLDGHVGRLENGSVLNLTISAPKLKRLRIHLLAQEEEEGYAYKIFIIADVPNLENLDLKESFLASYSLNNAKSLCKARIKITDMHAYEHPDSVLDYADRIHRLFAAILNVRYLKVSGPYIGVSMLLFP